MPFEISAGTQLQVPDGTYPAVLESVIEESGGKFGAQRKWTFLVEHDGKIDSLSGLSSTNTSPGSKSYQWLSALLGKEPQVGERYEDPTGTRVLLQLKKNDKGYMKIEAVLPFEEPQQVLPGVPR
jgi:hypothetical protein